MLCHFQQLRTSKRKSLMQTLAPMWLRPAIGILLSVLFAAGCGSSRTPIVHGIVRLDGRPLHSGTVVFRFGDGRETYAGIDPTSGEYVMDDPALSEGEVTITIVPDNPNPFHAAATHNGAQKPVGKPTLKSSAIPERYLEPSRSPLKNVIKPGDNVINIDLDR
jgi:hypothetical protein